MVERLGSVRWRGELHELATERVAIEPFDLRAKPPYGLVLDRISWWYLQPREWLKKAALLDDVYLLNNPFTVQAMEKHAAYCAMIRLGLKVPETWMVPSKVPPANERFQGTAERYNRFFDLDAIAERIGYPLYMKPFDGGRWVGVSRIEGPGELHRGYDESGERVMHLQRAVDFEVFSRSLSIGGETLVMRFDPEQPIHQRYQVDHDFLAADVGQEVVTIGKLVNAFFRWEFNSCETLVRDGQVYPIDYANPWPDVALTSLHYYFPWAIAALVRWSAYCLVSGRQMRLEQDARAWFAVGDRDDLSYEEKLAEYRRLADAYYAADEYAELCAGPLAVVDEIVREFVAGPEFDALLVDSVRSTFPGREHERWIAHYRGLLGMWVGERG